MQLRVKCLGMVITDFLFMQELTEKLVRKWLMKSLKDMNLNGKLDTKTKKNMMKIKLVLYKSGQLTIFHIRMT